MKNHLNLDLDPYEDAADALKIRKITKKRTFSRKKKSMTAGLPEESVALSAIAQEENVFLFSYHASRHEKVWLEASLGGMYQQKWIDDVLRLVKGGKEATVYLCKGSESSGTDLLAAKVYRPRQFRNLKDDHIYRQGRAWLDESGLPIYKDGELNAIRKGTAFGWELMHTSWIEYEYQTLVNLHEAGADVPKPYVHGNNAILMEYIGEEGTPAPVLNSIDLSRAEARELYQRVLHNLELFLAHNRIHGDLSAYNILYWEGDITLIDFPQVVDATSNPNALRIFERDLMRISEYFARFGVQTDPRRTAHRLWTAAHHCLVEPLDPRYLDADNPEDRRLWEKQQKQKR